MVTYTYTHHGQVESEEIKDFAGEKTTHEYYDASKYFQKKKVTDAKGRVTEFDYFAKGDPSPGKRGQVKWARDTGYNNDAAPSYQRQFTYAYNGWGQKISETNLHNIVTQYFYGTAGADLGNLIRVVQDPEPGVSPSAIGRPPCTYLHRMTRMSYDVMGRVTQSIDPRGQRSSFLYSALGQPEQAVFRTPTGATEETISYTYGINGRTERVDVNGSGGLRTTTIGYESNNDRVARVTDSLTGTIEYTYLATGERETMRLPGTSAPWRYRYYPGIYYGLIGGLLPKDDPNSAGLMLRTITDDRNESVGYAFNNDGRMDMAGAVTVRDSNGQPILLVSPRNLVRVR